MVHLPVHASWFNQEIFFGLITRQAIRRGSFRSVAEMTAAIGAYIGACHDRCHPFTWTRDAGQLLAKIRPVLRSRFDT